MSPARTFQSCGISSTRSERSQRPTAVTRGSPGAERTAPVSSSAPDAHGPELPELEAPAVLADALLPVEDAASRRRRDDGGGHSEEREKNDEQAGGDDHVEGALQRRAPFPRAAGAAPRAAAGPPRCGTGADRSSSRRETARRAGPTRQSRGRRSEIRSRQVAASGVTMTSSILLARAISARLSSGPSTGRRPGASAASPINPGDLDSGPGVPPDRLGDERRGGPGPNDHGAPARLREEPVERRSARAPRRPRRAGCRRRGPTAERGRAVRMRGSKRPRAAKSWKKSAGRSSVASGSRNRSRAPYRPKRESKKACARRRSGRCFPAVKRTFSEGGAVSVPGSGTCVRRKNARQSESAATSHVSGEGRDESEARVPAPGQPRPPSAPCFPTGGRR